MTGKFLAEFEIYVMLAIARLGDGAYGAALRDEIEQTTGRPVSIGALYSTLHRLEGKGMVRSREAEAEGRRGRPRKYCSLTAPGAEALEHSTQMLRRMMAGVEIDSAGRP